MSTSSSTRPTPKVLVLVGPTASGKTSLLDELFGSDAARTARGLPRAAVISADSMQAYRGLDIGTAKPDPALRARLPHSLIDILNPDEQYTAGDFVRRADAECSAIVGRGDLPVVAGGTGFYVRSFVCGLAGAPPADPEIRRLVARDLADRGREALREELARADPVSAARIHPNDEYRLTRALEILRATGRPLGDFAPSASARPGYDFLVLGVERERRELAERIDARVAAMIAAGLAEEAAALRAAGFGIGCPGMEAIGYREFLDAAPGESLGGIAARIATDTKRYAKRQMTFMRALPGIAWIPPDAEGLARSIREFLSR